MRSDEKTIPKPVRDMRLPSKVVNDYWITAYGDSCRSDAHEVEEDYGKWLIFVEPPFVDETWAKIRDAIYDGTLSSEAKVSTTRPNPNGDGHAHVICVYTVDGGHNATLVRQRLRTLGFSAKLHWKSDKQTYAGKYANRGFKRISKRYE